MIRETYYATADGKPTGTIDLHKILDNFPPYRNGEYRISRMVAKTPGQGVGTELMTQLCKDADAAGVTLVLEAMPHIHGAGKRRFQAARKRLMAFYARFGFRQISDLPPNCTGMMRRHPVEAAK